MLPVFPAFTVATQEEGGDAHFGSISPITPRESFADMARELRCNLRHTLWRKPQIDIKLRQRWQASVRQRFHAVRDRMEQEWRDGYVRLERCKNWLEAPDLANRPPFDPGFC